MMEFRARKSTQNLYWSFPSGPFFGTKTASADRGELLCLITPLSSISYTYSAFPASTRRGVYRGFLIGFESLTSIWCYTIFVHLKSFSSTSWNTCASFISIGSMCSLSSSDKWPSFLGSRFSYKALFFHFRGGLDGLIVSVCLSAFILTISDSETCWAIPRTVSLGTEDWRVLGSTRESIRVGKIPSIGIRAGSTYTKGERFLSLSVSCLPTATCRHRGANTIFSQVSQTTLCSVKWAPHYRGCPGPARPFFLRHLHGLRAVPLFTRRENCEGPVFCRRITVRSALSDRVV